MVLDLEDQKEVWKTINDYPRYQVSNMGRIKSLIGQEKILNPTPNKKGYLIADLNQKPTKKGEYKRKRFRVHRLVAEYFCEGYGDKKDIHHENLRRNDNRATNLICLTKKEHIEIHKKLKELEISGADQPQIGEDNGISSSSELENNKS